VLKDLDIVGKDGKLDDEAMQDVIDCLKELLPPELFNSLMGFKGPAFWDLVAEVCSPLRNVL
jgi:hypothetical protein